MFLEDYNNFSIVIMNEMTVSTQAQIKINL